MDIRKLNPNGVQFEVMQKSWPRLTGVISDGRQGAVLDLRDRKELYGLENLLGAPVVSENGEILYVSRDSRRLNCLRHETELWTSSFLVEYGIANYVGIWNGSPILELNGSDGSIVSMVDFTCKKLELLFALPDAASIVSRTFEFENDVVVLVATDTSIEIRSVFDGNCKVVVGDFIDYLPKRRLRVAKTASADGTFFVDFLDESNKSCILFEHETTDPASWTYNSLETYLGFSAEHSLLYRLHDRTLLTDLGRYARFRGDSTGSTVASLQKGNLGIIELSTGEATSIGYVGKNQFGTVQFSPDCQSLILDSRGLIFDEFDWKVIDL
jgi:hypothetical protein